MRFGQNEDEYGVLIAGAVARMLEREVLGQETREVRIELGDCDGGSPYLCGFRIVTSGACLTADAAIYCEGRGSS
jgi:hypothetical protein